MTTKALLKALVLAAASERVATVAVFCYRLDLPTSRENVRNVRACLVELRAAGALRSYVPGGTQDVVYYV